MLDFKVVSFSKIQNVMDPSQNYLASLLEIQTVKQPHTVAHLVELGNICKFVINKTRQNKTKTLQMTVT